MPAPTCFRRRRRSRAPDSAWHDRPVTLTFDAVDNGTGVKSTEYRIGGGGWVQGASVTLEAPAGGGDDGVHTVAHRLRTMPGTSRRTTPAPCASTPGAGRIGASAGQTREGAPARDRPLPRERCAQPGGARGAGRAAPRGRRGQARGPGHSQHGTALTCRLRCSFGRGRFVVMLGSATTDLAGNRLGSTTSRPLRVVR